MTIRLRRLLSITLALVVVIIGIIGYGLNQNDYQDTSGKITVTVTTTFLGDIVQQIGGEHVALTRLMGAGVDPHQYQASSSDLMKLTSADLVFYAGLHLEAKLGDVLEKLADSGKPIVNTSQDIPLDQLIYAQGITADEAAQMDVDEGVYDPHIWFDINLWRIVVAKVVESLKSFDATNAAFYEQNYQHYLNDLHDLDGYIQTQLAALPVNKRYLITAHDAFNYFGRYTGIQVQGIQGINTSVEAGTNDVSATANSIIEHQIKAIFVESSVSPKLIQALQEAVAARGMRVDIGGELFSDSTGALGTNEGTYIGMYRHNIKTIVEALK